MNPYLIIVAILAILGAFAAGEFDGQDRAHTKDVAATETLKAEAAATLATETKAKFDAETALSNLIAKTEKDRETLQTQNAADLRTRAAGPRLQFVAQTPGRGSGGSDSASSAPGSTSDTSTTVVQLPEPLNGNLLQFAADAQSLSIDYGALYNFLHDPKLVCELREP